MKKTKNKATKQEYDVSNLSQLDEFCALIKSQFQKRQLLLLNGPMASGKTTFVQHLIKSLGGTETSSPTYAIHQEYPLPQTSLWPSVDHVDLYRLKSDHDLESTGFWDLFEKDHGLIIVEWANRLEGQWWPPQWSVLVLDFSVSEAARVVTAII